MDAVVYSLEDWKLTPVTIHQQKLQDESAGFMQQ